MCRYPILSADSFYVSRVSCNNCFNVIYYGLYCICFFPFSIRCLCLSFMLIYSTGTARRVIYFEYTDIYILYMRGMYYCYCIYICIAVLSPVHSLPVFPGTKSEAVNGNYRGCKASVVDLCARNFPLGGFAILSAFENGSRAWFYSGTSLFGYNIDRLGFCVFGSVGSVAGYGVIWTCRRHLCIT